MLESDPRCSEAVDFIPLLEVHKMSDTDIAEFEKSIAPQLDIFIFQPIAALSLGERFSASSVTSFLSPDCLKISFQYPHLEAYTPFHNYPAAALGRAPFDYLDFEIVGQYLNGVRLDDVAKRLDERQLDDATVREIARWSIDELAAREIGDTGPVDIEITSLVRDRMEHEVMFRTINHPALPVMSHIADGAIELMDAAGIADKSIQQGPIMDPFARHNVPVHREVKRVFGLADDSELIYKGERISRDTAIAETYRYLGGFDRARIIESIDRLSAARPWFEAAL